MWLDLGRLVDLDQLHHADLLVIQDEPGHLFLTSLGTLVMCWPGGSGMTLLDLSGRLAPGGMAALIRTKSPSGGAVAIWSHSHSGETRYGGAMDVKRAADLDAEGWTLRRIGAELGLTPTTVSHQLRRAGVTIRRGGGPSAPPASTEQIRELRDQGLTWNEVATQVDMTVSGAWSRYRKARPSKSPRLDVGSRFSRTPLTRTLPLASVLPSLIISVEPPPGLS